MVKNTAKPSQGGKLVLSGSQEQITFEEESVNDGFDEETQMNKNMENNSKESKTSPVNMKEVRQGIMKTDESSRRENVERKSSPRKLANLVLEELKESFEKPKLPTKSSYTDKTASPLKDNQKVQSEIVSNVSSIREKDPQEDMEKRMSQQEEITMNVETIMNNDDEAESTESMENADRSTGEKEVIQDKFDTTDSLQEFFYNGQMGASTSGYNASDESGSDTEHAGKTRTFTVRKEVKPEIVNSSYAELKSITSSDTRATSPQDGRYIEPVKMEENMYYFKGIHAEESSGAEDVHVSKYRPAQLRKRKLKGSYMDDFSASDIGHTTEVLSSQNEGEHDTTDDQVTAVLNRMSKEEKLQLQSILSSSSSVKKRDSKVHFDDTHLAETKYYKLSETSNLDENSGEKGEGIYRDFSSEEDEPTTASNNDSQRKMQHSKNKNLRKRNKYPEINSRSLIHNPMDEKQRSAGHLPLASLPNLANLSPTMVDTLKQKLHPDAVKEALSVESHSDTIKLSDAASYEISRFISNLLCKAIESLADLKSLPEESLKGESSVESLQQTITKDSVKEIENADNFGVRGIPLTLNVRGERITSAGRDRKIHGGKREKPPPVAGKASKSLVMGPIKAREHSARKPQYLAFGSSPNLSPSAIHALSEKMKPLVIEEMMTIDGQRETMALPETVSDEISRLLSALLQRAIESIVDANSGNRTIEDVRAGGFQSSPDHVNSSSAESVQRIETLNIPNNTVNGPKHDSHQHSPTSSKADTYFHTAPLQPKRKVQTSEYQYEKGGTSSFRSLANPSDVLLKKIKMEGTKGSQASHESFVQKDEILCQLRNSVDHINNVQGMLRKASFNEPSTLHTLNPIPLPQTKLEERLKQLEQRSTPISTSPTKLFPQQRKAEETQTRSYETSVNGYQHAEDCDKDNSFIKRTDLSKRPEKATERDSTIEHSRHTDKIHFDTGQKTLKESSVTKNPKIPANLKAKCMKTGQDAKLPRCKTPEELQIVIETIKPNKQKAITDRSDIDLGLERGSSLFNKRVHMGSTDPHSVHQNKEHLSEKETNKFDIQRNKLEATLSWMSQQDGNFGSEHVPIERSGFQDNEKDQVRGRKESPRYDNSVSQGRPSQEKVKESDELRDPSVLPVTRSAPVPEHTMSSIAKLMFQNYFHERAMSDPKLSPEALEMLFSLLSAQSSDGPFEGYDLSDSTYSSSVLSSCTYTLPAQDVNILPQNTNKMQTGADTPNFKTMSPNLTKGSDARNTSSADSMETNAPSSELQNTSDLDTQNSLYSTEIEKSSKGLSSCDKTPSDIMIEDVIRLYNQYSKSRTITDDDSMTDRLTTALKLDKTTSTSDILYSNPLYLPSVSSVSHLPVYDDLQKSQEVPGSTPISTSRGASPAADQVTFSAVVCVKV